MTKQLLQLGEILSHHDEDKPIYGGLASDNIIEKEKYKIETICRDHEEQF